MIPFNPWSTSTLWYQAWRVNVRRAKAAATDNERATYCYAAALAQAQYVTYAAIDRVNYYGPK